MIPKRNFQGFGHPVQEPKRRLTVPRDSMSGLTLNEMASKMEPFIRKVVREVVENKIQLWLHASSRSSLNPNETSGGRGLHLHFANSLPTTIFTNSKLESTDSSLVKIVLFDAATNSVVTCGPLSSIKIEIFVLDGDFGSDDLENWSEKEFDDKVLREREGKKPLLTGELKITLKDGVGYIGNIIFTDNSSWIRSRKFRLGARIIKNNSFEGRIREARSEAFIVKDRRGESYMKHHPPALGDDIWRLEKIAKDGALYKRLAYHGIYTVKELLHKHVTDSSSLREILGVGISNKIWETIIEHAASVVDDGKLYVYYTAAQRVGLVLNYVLKVVGVIFEGQSFQSLDQLTFAEKRMVDDLKQQAYKNVKDLIPFNEPSIVAPALSFTSPQVEPFINSNLNFQQIDDFPVTPQDRSLTQLGFNLPSTSTSYTYEAENGAQLVDSAAQKFQPAQLHIPILCNSLHQGNLSSGLYNFGGISWSPDTSSFLVGQSTQLATVENSHVKAPPWGPFTWEQGNGFIFTPSNEAEVGIIPTLPNFSLRISGNKNPKVGWFKIRAALKWGISIRRDVAAKRTAGLLY